MTKPKNRPTGLRPYNDIREEYRAAPPDMFTDDPDDRAEETKRIIDECLNDTDRTIVLLYADCRSFRKLGARLGFSHATMRREVVRIRRQVVEEYFRRHPDKRK